MAGSHLLLPLEMVSLSRRWLTLLLLLCLHITAVGTSSVEAAAEIDGAASAVHESEGINIRGLEEPSLIDLQHGDETKSSDGNDSKQIRSSNTTEIFQRAIRKAIGGGIPGAIAGAVQVLGLMWLVSTLSIVFLCLVQNLRVSVSTFDDSRCACMQFIVSVINIPSSRYNHCRTDL